MLGDPHKEEVVSKIVNGGAQGDEQHDHAKVEQPRPWWAFKLVI